MTRPHRTQRGSATLARRLRSLRESHWPGRLVTQKELAEAFGRRDTSISAYENESSPSPPESRLWDYATFFATERSLASGHGRLLNNDELTDDERAARDGLYQELLSLRSGTPVPTDRPASSAAADLWTFPEGDPVRVVCGELQRMTHPYSDPTNPNHTELLRYADLDALVELYAHLWRLNPTCDVRFMPAGRLSDPDDLNSHLVMIGGIGLNAATEQIVALTDLPITQRKTDLFADGEVFDLGDGGEPFLPEVSRNPELGLTSDLGLLARLTNPYNTARTLTLCNGVCSRGVLGAVRTLTDDKLKDQNETYLTIRFAGATQFAILMRVPVLRGKALTPDLQKRSVRLYEWSDRDRAESPAQPGEARPTGDLRTGSSQ